MMRIQSTQWFVAALMLGLITVSGVPAGAADKSLTDFGLTSHPLSVAQAEDTTLIPFPSHPLVVDPGVGDSPCRDFSGQNFAKQQLPFSRFRYNRLEQACFHEAILTESDFRHATLLGTDFRKSSLMGVDFRWANLSNARFEGANLRDARVKHAIFTGATFDSNTQFPLGFVPAQWGMVQVCPE